MNSKILCKEDFDFYSDWHEFLEEHADKYEQLDDDTIIYFLDSDKSSKQL